MPECIFCRIARGEVPVEKIYEDDEFVAFWDANPVAPAHALVIPREHYETVANVKDAGLLGRGLAVANETARRIHVADAGYRIVINCREDGGQTVYHLHFHVLGGRFMAWPPG